MHNILIIAKREYLERVRSRSFVIMTFLIPAADVWRYRSAYPADEQGLQ